MFKNTFRLYLAITSSLFKRTSQKEFVSHEKEEDIMDFEFESDKDEVLEKYGDEQTH